MTTPNQACYTPAIGAQRTARKVSLLNTLFNLHRIWTERRQLARMDTAQLRDLGLSRQDAEKEARRPAWDAPNQWLR